MLTLNCVIVGEGGPFTVEIDAAKSVGVLKNKIKDDNSNTITCDAKALELYLALKGVSWLPDDDPDLKGLSQPAQGHEVVESYVNAERRMKTTRKLKRYFSTDGDYPAYSDEEENIHVVVVVPNGAVPSNCRHISVTDLLTQNSLPGMEFTEALEKPVGFDIPVFDAQYVSMWPNSFTQGKAEYGACIDEFLEFTMVNNSELSVVSLDSMWLKLFKVLCTCKIYRDECRESSPCQGRRPDAVIVKKSVLVGKCESKASQKQIENATLELTDRMADDAYLTFPRGMTSIPAWTTCPDLIQLHRLSFNPLTKKYETTVVRPYYTSNFNFRHDFVVDVFKILKWVFAIQDPNALMHLFPQVRTITPNGHYMTWLKTGIFKKFKTGANVNMKLIQRVYSASLQHVERGECNHVSVTISSIEQTLQNALVHFQDKRHLIIHQIRNALDELHNIGVAHCDVRAANVFVLLSDKRVILGGLEYCRPLDASPPDVKRKSESCKTALELDDLSLMKSLGLCAAFESMQTKSLWDVLSHPKLAARLSWPKQKIQYAIDVCRALDYMHSLRPKLIHRNVKASKVRLSKDYRVAKLNCFDLSRDQPFESFIAKAGLTDIQWSAPELLIQGDNTEQVDIYAFGVLLF
ncbi:hypothetical protein LEN26_012656 [Aphanomyces euteiches]|nr:hypothetical protein LEN26_012656 [Aphanomyces euteiches]KAH9127011.1 hypothetical protein AeMF1_002610 [Aphanomyces euteiches]